MPDGMDDMTPEQIIGKATGLMPIAGKHIVQALADAGKVIVDREALKNLLRAQVRSDKLTDQIIDELTKDTGS